MWKGYVTFSVNIHYEIYRFMTMAYEYNYHNSFIRNCDTLYSELFIPFLIKFYFFFVTINTHTHIKALCSVEDKALLYQPEGFGFGALCYK
jgi:hypothetical protein